MSEGTPRPDAEATPADAGAAPTPRVETPSPDVAAPSPETALPGAHRGGFTRPPTAPIRITVEQPELVPVTGNLITPPPAAPPANFAATALGFAIVGLICSFVVGIALPIGVTAIVLGILSLRRPFESRGPAIWAIALAALSVVYSIGWLVWAAYRGGWIA